MITSLRGVGVGHWTNAGARTGCTVVLLPEGNVASGEVRGGAPGTREFALLEPTRLVSQVDAVLLTGGSAFGLAACDGVVRWCEANGRGFGTPAGAVPIVVGMVLFDLSVGDGSVRPGPSDGYAACEAAAAGGDVEVGPVGAGAGATVGKWRGRDAAEAGGVGSAAESYGDVTVAALVAVNAYGDVLEPGQAERRPLTEVARSEPFTNTTIGVVGTNARIDKTGCHLLAQAAHDGLARAVEPAHTQADGDAFVSFSTGEIDAPDVPVTVLAILAARAVEAAIRSAVSLRRQ
ncbi:MAG TPA: P1 family peptidase [Acidimicrobiales bacterium]